MDKPTDAVTSLRPYWGTENSEDETYLEEASHWDKVLEDGIFLLGFLCLSLSASCFHGVRLPLPPKVHYTMRFPSL